MRTISSATLRSLSTDSSSPMETRIPSGGKARAEIPDRCRTSPTSSVSAPTGSQTKLPEGAGHPAPAPPGPRRGPLPPAHQDLDPRDELLLGVEGGVPGRERGSDHGQRDGRGARGVEQRNGTDRVAEAQAGEPPGLGEGAQDHEVRVPAE